MRQLVVAILLVAVVAAEPARLRSRFLARQEAGDEAPPTGLYGAPQPPKPSGYQYPKPEYGLPEPTTTTAQPETEPEAATQGPQYLTPEQGEQGEEGDADLEPPTEETEGESEAVAGGDENDVEESQADQLRQYKQARRLVKPLKLVDGRPAAKLQRLVYYPLVSARLQAAQPVLAAAPVSVAYYPENGFAYSSQVFHQQNW